MKEYFSVNVSNFRSFYIVKPYTVLKIDILRYAGQDASEKKNKQTNKQKNKYERSFDLFKLYSLMIRSLSFDSFLNGHLQMLVITVYGIQAKRKK